MADVIEDKKQTKSQKKGKSNIDPSEFKNVEVITGTEEAKKHIPFAPPGEEGVRGITNVHEQEIGVSDPKGPNYEP
jgi:hypothetical protein